MSVLADWLARRRALLAIQRCRTPALGGHVYQCADCSGIDYAYHSCHHRACPRCGGARTAGWTAKQQARLLPVPYFLVTFTVPKELRFAFKVRPELLHDLLFACAAASLQTVADMPRHLGGELGMIGVLHTWGRQLQHHPHLHSIAAGGGLSADQTTWRPSRGSKWLLPIDAVGAQFRLAFEEALRAGVPELHAQVSDLVWHHGWWVNIQPAGCGQAVLRYLARYVCRTAIGDERIVAADDDAVTFRYTDSATQQKQECMLGADDVARQREEGSAPSETRGEVSGCSRSGPRDEQFMRRYLQHVLPPGQHRVRYNGWMHPAAKVRRTIVDGARQRGDGHAAGMARSAAEGGMSGCPLGAANPQTLLSVVFVVRSKMDTPPPWRLRCPHCESFALVRVGRLARAPPVCLR